MTRPDRQDTFPRICRRHPVTSRTADGPASAVVNGEHMNRRWWKICISLLFCAAAPAGIAAGAAGTSPGKLLFKLNFTGKVGALPSKKQWHYDTGWDPNCRTYYRDDRQTLGVVKDSHTQSGKALAIRVIPYPGKPGAFESARITTFSNAACHVQYGLIEARIKVPGGPAGAGSGSWPAFWLLGTNIPQVGWPQCGEIDVMESAGNRPGVVTGTIHGPGTGAGAPYTLPAGKEFWRHYHIFGVQWSPREIEFLCDGHVYALFTPSDQAAGSWVFDHPFYIILNVAEGGAYGGAPAPTATYPQTMYVDWIRAYRWTLAAPTALRVRAAGHDRVRVGWTDTAFDESGFVLQRSTSADFSSRVKEWKLSAMNSSIRDSGLSAGVTYYYRISAVEGNHQSAWSLIRSAVARRGVPAALTNAAGRAVIAVNCGGPAGDGFLADRYFTKSATDAPGRHPVIRTGNSRSIPESVYQSNRYGSFTYTLPHLKPHGRYILELNFCEGYWHGPRKRLFAVFADGVPILNDFDIYAAAGGRYKAVNRLFRVKADRHGKLVLRFVSQRDNAQVNGIEVYPAR